jgi:hypothetical protein
MEKPKLFWHRHELPVAEYLMSHKQGLIYDFLQGHKTLRSAVRTKTKPVLDWRSLGIPLEKSSHYINRKSVDGEFEPDITGWQGVRFRYERHDNFNISYTISEEEGKKFPTGYEIIKHFGDACVFCTYSVMAPQSVLKRHTGPENREGKYIRIHMPLIIPQGDIFFECFDEVVTWDDIWGFNNQIGHSAHNYTDEYRLIFLIDLERAAIGMGPGDPYDERYDYIALGEYVRPSKDTA